MPISHKVEEVCPRCKADSDAWMFVKQEGSGEKECYTCESCGCEWVELKD